MEVIKVRAGETLARKNDKVKYWYLVQEGAIIQQFGFSNVRLEKNAIIGMFERDMYQCDYVAGLDTSLAAFSCGNATELKAILAGKEVLRNIFLRAAIEQRHQLLCLYTDLFNKARQYHMFVETVYNDYKTFCAKYKVEASAFSRMEHFNALEMRHKAENWEVNNSVSIVKNYLAEYLKLMSKDDSLTVGVIMEASLQMRRFAQGIGEIEAYLSYNKDIMIAESQNDMLKRFFDLAAKVHAKRYDIEPIIKDMNLMIKVAEKINVYNERLLNRRFNEFKNYDFDSAANGEVSDMPTYPLIDITKEDCLDTILEYAGYAGEEAEEISKMLETYRKLPDMNSSDNKVYALRKKIASIYYEIYYKAFIRSMKEESMNPILLMFFNFGFMDASFMEVEHAEALYEVSAHLDICQSENVYTIYEWLKCIYNGTKPTSKNEFDMDYPAYLNDLKKNGKVKESEIPKLLADKEKRVEFEIQNLFATGNKITYGRVTTFCPVLAGKDLINSVEKMLVTAERITTAMNEIRKIDYSAFYREVMFSDVEKGINNEKLMKEVLPDIILMPNAGGRAIMWQETTGVKRDTKGRVMFPILTASDVDNMMLEVVGSFRWELCRHIEGMRWNDVREKSLTAEYCTYLQFYKKNHDLSAEAKEKIKSTLIRAKNSFREVFISDYVNWIKFEAKGSFRLNKVSRDILARYCPFAKVCRDELRANPLYQTFIAKSESDAAQKLHHFNMVYDKYVENGGVITAELKENLLFYEL